MSAETLRKAIFWAMTENLRIQFVYPDYQLSEEVLQAIDSIDHADIRHNGDADVIVCNGVQELQKLPNTTAAVVLRTPVYEILNNYLEIAKAAIRCTHLSIVITDIEDMTEETQSQYKAWLKSLAKNIKSLYAEGKSPQINLLTDRIQLDSMNNCNAGWESITLAPNGKFYICPAFYYENEANDVGDLKNGIEIPNAQLYRLDHAPICRKCDAFQCRRCVWLNKKTTLEVNTPSREQCVAAHLERNASQELLRAIRELGEFAPGKDIPSIDYIDPFEKILEK